MTFERPFPWIVALIAIGAAVYLRRSAASSPLMTIHGFSRIRTLPTLPRMDGNARPVALLTFAAN